MFTILLVGVDPMYLPIRKSKCVQPINENGYKRTLKDVQSVFLGGLLPY